MFFRLLLLFTTVPLIELALLVEIGRHVGLLTTVALVFFTGVLGAWLARSQGLRTLSRLQSELQAGRMPTEPLLDGLMIFVAGAVLLTPGMLTDLFGFALLTPAFRRIVQRVVAGRLKQRFVFAGPGVTRRSSTGPGPAAQGPAASAPGTKPQVIIIEPDEE
ncbi:MAG: FxsA family protein [Acidobacteriota bacterium]